MLICCCKILKTFGGKSYVKWSIHAFLPNFIKNDYELFRREKHNPFNLRIQPLHHCFSPCSSFPGGVPVNCAALVLSQHQEGAHGGSTSYLFFMTRKLLDAIWAGLLEEMWKLHSQIKATLGKSFYHKLEWKVIVVEITIYCTVFFICVVSLSLLQLFSPFLSYKKGPFRCKRTTAPMACAVPRSPTLGWSFNCRLWWILA